MLRQYGAPPENSHAGKLERALAGKLLFDAACGLCAVVLLDVAGPGSRIAEMTLRGKHLSCEILMLPVVMPPVIVVASIAG